MQRRVVPTAGDRRRPAALPGTTARVDGSGQHAHWRSASASRTGRVSRQPAVLHRRCLRAAEGRTPQVQTPSAVVGADMIDFPTANVALTAPLTTYRACWLEVRCNCGSVVRLRVLGLLLAGGRQTLGASIKRLRCRQCSSPPSAAWLCEAAIRERTLGDRGMAPGWSVQVLS